MSNAAEVINQEQVLEQRALSLADQARAVVVTDQDSLGRAGEFGKSLRDMRKQIVDYFAPIKKSAHEAWKGICAKENEAVAPIDAADAALRKTMNAYLAEQERLRREEETRLRRIEEEKARKEQEKLLAQAAKAEDKGQTEKAEALLERAEDVYVAPVSVGRAAPVQTGNATVGTAKELTVEVVDLKAFIGALVKQDSNAFDALFQVKPSALKAWAKTNGIKRFDGLRIEETFAARIR